MLDPCRCIPRDSLRLVSGHRGINLTILLVHRQYQLLLPIYGPKEERVWSLYLEEHRAAPPYQDDPQPSARLRKPISFSDLELESELILLTSDLMFDIASSLYGVWRRL